MAKQKDSSGNLWWLVPVIALSSWSRWHSCQTVLWERAAWLNVCAPRSVFMCVCWRLERLRGANFTPFYLHWPQETSSVSIITSSWFKWDRRDCQHRYADASRPEHRRCFLDASGVICFYCYFLFRFYRRIKYVCCILFVRDCFVIF